MYLNHYTAELDHSQWCSSANFCSSACALVPVDAPFHELSKYVICFAVALELTELALKEAICFGLKGQKGSKLEEYKTFKTLIEGL
jgi:hypothetical protein